MPCFDGWNGVEFNFLLIMALLRIIYPNALKGHKANLKLLLGNAYTPTINVIVSNASKIDDKLVNPNGGVTTVKK